MELGNLEDFGSIFRSIFIVSRALEGKNERNRRAVFAFGEKGLKTVDISVMNLVIMVAVGQVLSPSISWVSTTMRSHRSALTCKTAIELSCGIDFQVVN
jgi:hypothetical protein